MNEKNIRLVTAESVRAGHPDKFCDQVADAILDAHLRQDPNAHVAVEVFATAGKIVVGGEITSKAKISYDKIVAGVINRIGYTMSDLCGDPHELLELEVCLHEQSPDISAAVDKTELGAGETLGAGDQGIMVGYATNETEEYLPLPVVLAHRICRRLDELKPSTPWLGEDGKAQVTVAYENDMPVAVTAVVVSLQHDAEIDHKSIRRFIGKEVLGKVLPRELLKEDTRILVNPSGKFVLGGPAADFCFKRQFRVGIQNIKFRVVRVLNVRIGVLRRDGRLDCAGDQLKLTVGQRLLSIHRQRRNDHIFKAHRRAYGRRSGGIGHGVVLLVFISVIRPSECSS